jgi:hypothetical protein
MIGSIPSYGDYVRTGQGGPEGKCQACGYEGAMDRSLTGYMCVKCRSVNVVMKLKDGRRWHQQSHRIEAAG